MKVVVLLLSVMFFIGCRKETCREPQPPAHPSMQYKDLDNKAIPFGQQHSINLDDDQTNDILFSTMLVGDPVLERDRQQYFVSGNFHVSFPINQQEQTLILNKGDTVQPSIPGYNWYNANSAVLAEKIIELNGTEHWQGNWKNAHHNFIAVQILKNEQFYYGWVELSFDTTTEKMILHKAAISKEANKSVEVGY